MTFTVDIHHHLLPDFYRRATEHDGQSVGGVRPAVWTRANALSFMGDAGIDVAVAVASISAPGVDEMGVVPDEEGSRSSAADTFARLYFDTALSWSNPTLHTLRAVVGIDRVLYGSDYPYLPKDIAARGRAQLAASPELSDHERTAIFNETATTLLPRLAAYAPAAMARPVGTDNGRSK